MADIGKKSYGKKMFLITPSEYDKYKRLESNPYFLKKPGADIKNQLSGEKIMSNQTKAINDFEKQKRDMTSLLKPVLTEALANTSIFSKEKIKQILLIISSLTDVRIDDDA